MPTSPTSFGLSLSSLPARYNDYVVRSLHEGKGATSLSRWADRSVGVSGRKLCQAVLARLVGVVVFPFFAATDLLSYVQQAIKEHAWAVISKDSESKKAHIQQANKCMKEAEKCFFGILASPAGLVSPDIVTRHFVPKFTAAGLIETPGKYHSAAGKEEHPKTVEEVKQLVEKAIQNGKKVTISGAHLSQSKNTLPTREDNVCINMHLLNQVRIDPEKRVAIVQAGATWRDVQAAGNTHGFGVRVMQASNVFSIGGSLGVNCHGWDHRTGTVAKTVRSLTIIDAEGKQQVIRPGDELFGLVIGGHGLFGVIVEAEIELTENELLVSWGEPVLPENYATYFQEKILPDANHVMHLYRLSIDPVNLLKEGVAVSYSKKTATHTMPEVGVCPLSDEPETGTRVDRILMHIARSLPISRGMYWAIESRRIIAEKRLSRNEIMRPVINAIFNNSRADAEWLQEYFVKPCDLTHVLKKLSEVLTANDVSLLNATVRYVKKDEISHLPYAKGEDHCAVVLFFNQSLAVEEVEKTKKWIQEMIDYLISCGGTYYLPYQHFATKAQFATCYPQLDHIIEMKDRYDKNGLFDNGFYQDYIHQNKQTIK